MDEERKDINLTGSFTAADIEEIIRALAGHRATMAPPVPRSRKGAALLDMQVTLIEPESVELTAIASGGARIWLRHAGLGWIAFELDRAQLEWLANLITQQAGDRHTRQ
jgi:hypothetical protein